MEILQPLAVYQRAVLGTPTPLMLSPATTRPSTPIAPSQQPTSLLHLPTEIRLQIYSHLLLSKLHLVRKSLLPSGPLLHPAILSTCHLINGEATALLYEYNVFVAHPTLLLAYPHHESPKRPLLSASLISRIRHWRIIIRLDCDARFSVDDARRAFNGAETLVVEAEESAFRTAGYRVLLVLEGVRGVKLARVEGSVEPDVARWLERRLMSDEEWDGFSSSVDVGHEPWSYAGR